MSEIDRPRVLLVNRCVITEGDRLLLVQRSSQDRHLPGLWEVPGGKLDHGQDTASALEREVREETGLTIEPVSPLVYADSHLIEDGKYAGLPYVVLVSIGRVVTGELKLSDEHDAFTWDTVDEALERELTPESERAIRHLGATLLADAAA